ncbi:uncharacterized protein LOC129777871 [Toxorhynchites rutilus septentrionalis]|uniref:uncharacterized protein LOC129777871 n=1 Tax=Toxorhynchites rutilus septentrionalis TaxID=329112 RepID=UPI0024793291|nr:uncharacterized protein LOC129777871 [Toxorhynchites rutilus septentrionalis]
MDELGWVLMNHNLITRNESIQQHANGNRPNHFKLNMERLCNLLEQQEQNNHAELTSKKQNKFLRMLDAILQNDIVLKEIKEMVAANRLLSEIRYVTTVERMLKHNLDPSLRCCFVCREYFRTADEYTSHFEKLHGEKFLIVAAVDRFQTSQKFNVLHHYNALNPVTIFTICNVYHTALIKKKQEKTGLIFYNKVYNLPLSTKIGEPLYRLDMEWLIHIRQKKCLTLEFNILYFLVPLSSWRI